MSGGPLDGVRVLDFTRHLAGAGSTRILATLGAEILRIEWPHPPALDFLRLSGPHADGRPGMNRGGFFAQINVGKRSVAIDMATDAGKGIARELIPHCDVIAESFSPGVMKRWGLDYEAARALRADVIYLSASGFGQTGPYAGYRSVGPTAQAYSGLTATSGLPEREPAGWGFSYMDHMGAVMNAAAILMGLERRRATGEGEFFDAGQSQHGCALLGPMLLDVSLNGSRVHPKGNRDLYGNFCPNNAYRCRGEDSWLAISVREPEEWAALCAVIGADDLAGRAELATLAGRLAHEDANRRAHRGVDAGAGRARGDGRAAGGGRARGRRADGRGQGAARPAGWPSAGSTRRSATPCWASACTRTRPCGWRASRWA